jgi:hypothetical protein
MGEPKSIDEELLTDSIRELIASKKKTDEDKLMLQKLKDISLSAGAKTYLKNLAKEFVYDFKTEFTSKYTDKGLIVEDEARDLYNRVMGTNYEKNFERKENAWLSGECDIDTGDKIVDIKASWSLNTFPGFSEDGIDSGYEWQGRAYMMLWNRPAFENAFCLVSTPEGLLKEGEEVLHSVDHLSEAMRVTIVRYERELELEDKIKSKVDAANVYYEKMVSILKNEHIYKGEK